MRVFQIYLLIAAIPLLFQHSDPEYFTRRMINKIDSETYFFRKDGAVIRQSASEGYSAIIMCGGKWSQTNNKITMEMDGVADTLELDSFKSINFMRYSYFKDSIDINSELEADNMNDWVFEEPGFQNNPIFESYLVDKYDSNLLIIIKKPTISKRLQNKKCPDSTK